MAGATVTDEHVQQAWRRLRKPHWPVSLPEVLEHPMWGRCVRGLALALANAERGQARVQTCARPPAPMTPPLRHTPPAFDRKRAAAGEREDDMFPETRHS